MRPTKCFISTTLPWLLCRRKIKGNFPAMCVRNPDCFLEIPVLLPALPDTDIGIPGGGDNERATCIPTAINSAGNIVGCGRQVDNKQVAFFWSPTSGFTTLGDRSRGCDNGNTAYA